MAKSGNPTLSAIVLKTNPGSTLSGFVFYPTLHQATLSRRQRLHLPLLAVQFDPGLFPKREHYRGGGHELPA
jgi:hypothetical protein